MMPKFPLALSGLILILFMHTAPAQTQAEDAQQVMRILHMLDYVGVDYPEFVRKGRVLDEAEYVEQVEFAREIDERIRALPPHPARAGLAQRAAGLRQAIGDKVDGSQIAWFTAELSRELRKAYPVKESPRTAPDVAAAAALYQQQCAQCHGADGNGEGPAGFGLEPAPTNFQETARQRQRSVFGLYNIISLGVEGTGMASYAQLPEEQRWALAFYVGQLAYDDATRKAGEIQWRSGETAGLQDLHGLSTALPAELEAAHGAKGRQLMAYLRANPQVLEGETDPLGIAAGTLADSLQAYERGDADSALKLALDAYLEGFELGEAALSALDSKLMRQTEAAMLRYRQLVKAGAPVEQVRSQADTIQAQLAEGRERLAGGGLSQTGSFLGSFVILTREGLEAILLLAAMLAFLNRTERPGARKYVHAGWIAALLMGGLTWYAASYLISISGANRELTEGVSALVAAVVLLSVGLWMHNKSYAARWQAYVSEHLGKALSGAGLWGLAGLAFIATYREVFETVLFYQALWGQGDHQAILWGIAAAAVTLLVIAVAIFYFSMRLPIRQFFSASSILIVVLAVIFTGKGVAAIQEAGLLPVNSVDFVSIPVLGIYPTLQVLLMQAVVLALVLGGFAWNHLSLRRQTA